MSIPDILRNKIKNEQEKIYPLQQLLDEIYYYDFVYSSLKGNTSDNILCRSKSNIGDMFEINIKLKNSMMEFAKKKKEELEKKAEEILKGVE